MSWVRKIIRRHSEYRIQNTEYAAAEKRKIVRKKQEEVTDKEET